MKTLTSKKLFRYRLMLTVFWFVGLVSTPGVVFVSKSLLEAVSLVATPVAIFFGAQMLGVPRLNLDKIQAHVWFFLTGMFTGLLIASLILPTPEGGSGLVGGLFWMTLLMTTLTVSANWFKGD